MEKLSQNKLVLFGDFNQGKFYFRYTKLLETFDSLQLLNLNWNFRCSEPVVNFANTILSLQRAYIGGEFESHSIQNMLYKRSEQPIDADVYFLDLAQSSQLKPSSKSVFITQNEDSKQQIFEKYPDQIFTVLLPDQISGLEFDEIILYDFIGQDYLSLATHIEKALVCGKDKQHQPADKNKAAEHLKDIEKFRSLFLAATRAKNSICFIADATNRFVKILGREFFLKDSSDRTQSLSCPP